MLDFWKKKPALGVGLGVGLLGAVALALRYGMQRVARQPLPDNISPRSLPPASVRRRMEKSSITPPALANCSFSCMGIYPGASSFEWSRVYPQFAVGHEVVAPDLIGFGESERPRRGLDADEHVRALADLLFTIGQGRPASIVAAGFGASLAVKLAVQHPDLVRRLVLYAPLGLDASMRRMPLGLSTLSRLPALNRFVYRNYFARRPFIRNWLARFGFGDPALVGDDVIEVLTSFASQYGAEHALLAFLRGQLLYDVKSSLGASRSRLPCCGPICRIVFLPRRSSAWSDSFRSAGLFLPGAPERSADSSRPICSTASSTKNSSVRSSFLAQLEPRPLHFRRVHAHKMHALP